MYQLCFYVPESHLETVKLAVFDAGAGHVGNYECCAWQTQGLGQFRPKKGSQPYVGEQEKLETVVEYKVELVCEDEIIKAAVIALLDVHPYEEPAYSVWRLEDIFNS
jgi:hypothetical protein